MDLFNTAYIRPFKYFSVIYEGYYNLLCSSPHACLHVCPHIVFHPIFDVISFQVQDDPTGPTKSQGYNEVSAFF